MTIFTLSPPSGLIFGFFLAKDLTPLPIVSKFFVKTSLSYIVATEKRVARKTRACFPCDPSSAICASKIGTGRGILFLPTKTLKFSKSPPSVREQHRNAAGDSTPKFWVIFICAPRPSWYRTRLPLRYGYSAVDFADHPCNYSVFIVIGKDRRFSTSPELFGLLRLLFTKLFLLPWR